MPAKTFFLRCAWRRIGAKEIEMVVLSCERLQKQDQAPGTQYWRRWYKRRVACSRTCLIGSTRHVLLLALPHCHIVAAFWLAHLHRQHAYVVRIFLAQRMSCDGKGQSTTQHAMVMFMGKWICGVPGHTISASSATKAWWSSMRGKEVAYQHMLFISNKFWICPRDFLYSVAYSRTSERYTSHVGFDPYQIWIRGCQHFTRWDINSWLSTLDCQHSTRWKTHIWWISTLDCRHSTRWEHIMRWEAVRHTKA